jgi:hypothetical protein
MTTSIRLSVLLALGLASAVSFADGFDRVKCSDDPAKALRGVRLELGKRNTAQIEAAHKAIALHFDGADGMPPDDPYGTQYWRICDREFVTLHDLRSGKPDDKVRDVLAVPTHPATQQLAPPSRCKRGTTVVDDVLAMMPKAKGEATPTAAWRVDRDKLTFVVVPVEGLRCTSE